jgi:hypothetical protein
MEKIIQITIVPVLIFVSFLASVVIFRKEIAFLIRNITKIKAKDIIDIEATNKELKEINKKVDDLNTIVEQEFAFKDYLSAHNALEKDINSYLSQCKNDGVENPRLNIVVIAVSMVFSWRFLRDRIPEFLQNHPGLSIDLKLLWVDPELLKSIGMSRFSDINWTEISRKRLVDTQDFLDLHPQCRERLRLQARIYRNLPHWHGILFNEKHLYLGRVNWSFPEDNRPKITCGRNKYRYFDITSDMGRERIDLFKSWYKYYSNFLSDLVYDSNSSQ